MPDTTRTFVALPLPADRIESLERLQGRLAAELKGVRWVEPRHFHVTLAFLGDVDHVELREVLKAVEQAVAGHSRLDLALQGAGAFPDPARPRVLWAGLTGPGLEPLGRLQQDVAAALRAVGYAPDRDRFSPHVTLGRVKPGRGQSPDATAALAAVRGWRGGPFRADEVVTFASHLTPEGPEYTPLARARLVAGKPATPP